MASFLLTAPYTVPGLHRGLPPAHLAEDELLTPACLIAASGSGVVRTPIALGRKAFSASSTDGWCGLIASDGEYWYWLVRPAFQGSAEARSLPPGVEHVAAPVPGVMAGWRWVRGPSRGRRHNSHDLVLCLALGSTPATLLRNSLAAVEACIPRPRRPS